MSSCLFDFGGSDSVPGPNNTNATECIPFRAVQITYVVGIPVFILLLVAVLTLSTVVCCMGAKLRAKKKKSSRVCTEEGEIPDDSDIQDSFDDIEDDKRDTVNNKKYEPVKPGDADNNSKGEGFTIDVEQNVQEAPQYSVVKKKKKKKKGKQKKKKNSPEDGTSKEAGYNKLARMADNNSPCVEITAGHRESYSVLHASEAGGVEETKGAEPEIRILPLPPLEIYEDVCLGDEKESTEGFVQITGNEVVYYNDVAVKRSCNTDVVAGRGKVLDIYTRSVSMGAPDSS